MARKPVAPSREILEAALQGLLAQQQRLNEQITEVRSLLGGRGARSAKVAGGNESETPQEGSHRRRRALSPEARKRIAAAQKKRWAAFRKAQG